MAKTATKKFMLTDETTQAEALQAVADKLVPIEAYQEWDAAHNKRNGRATIENQISVVDFKAHAEPVTVTIGGQSFSAEPKQHEAGKSLGWYLGGKATIKVGDKDVKVQVGLNLTVIGSKPKGK